MSGKVFGSEEYPIHVKYLVAVIIISVAIAIILLLLPHHVNINSPNIIFLDGVIEISRNEYVHYFNLSENEEEIPSWAIKVKVFNPRNSTSIEGARVFIYGAGGNGTNFTDENGIASIVVSGCNIPKNKDAVKLSIEVTKDKYRPLNWKDVIIFCR
ncbi:MAG: hypothetical protein U9O96_08510 [Candidatus Thermoplasmatota archaeon]|nr:hypothetical protein [Candidatus Thermoplasmatota archaeon]